MKEPVEIKKALECCSKAEDYVDCMWLDCPYAIKDGYNCVCENKMGKDALEYIEVLENYNREIFERMPKWVSVKERLPEPDEDVLLIAHGWEGRLLYLGCLHHTNAEKSWLTGITSAESEWCIRGWSYLKVPLVTHWMPLPDLPREDCNG